MCVLNVIVNNHFLVILILIIYNEYINNNIGKYYLLDMYGYQYTPNITSLITPGRGIEKFILFILIGKKKKRNFADLRPSLRSESSKEFRQPPLWRVDILLPKRASPNLTGIKNNTRTMVGRSDNK